MFDSASTDEWQTKQSFNRVFGRLLDVSSIQIPLIKDYLSSSSVLADKIFTQKTKTKTLGELCDIIMGQSPSSSSYNTISKGLPLIQGNLDLNNGITFPRMWTTEITKQCQIGDIILTVRAPVGDIAKAECNACIGRGVCAIRSNSAIYHKYIYQYLGYFKSKWSSIEQGSTFAAVSRSDISKISIPFMPESCMIKSTQLLSLIDDKIRIEDFLLGKYKLQKFYLLSRLFI